ncbi:NAD(P)H-binding protein (plasmid) [Embleya sp. NBC_00888]|uniref:NAD(P)-dependent oxidoreductase n=1 Tax=Embleya sp. NBC_00888 TaxID=2975960 RepID=UPI002F907DDE|nr:NAD(P)H-binding protein [Embleya sp. NBC_00888]
MRIAVFGANGPTGRLVTGRALAAGHRVAAVTRQPDSFPLHHDRLEVVGADVLDPVAVDAVVTGRDAVLSTLGVPAAKGPINTYSQGAANIVAAMKRHRVRRLTVVSSSGVDPHPYSDGGFLFNRVLLPYVTKVLGKTLYDDMRRMETLVRSADLDWTIVRPSGLYHLPSATDYTLVQGHADGRFTARVDLAACMLALLDDDRHLRTTVGVVTTVDNPTLLRWIRREALAKHDAAGPSRSVETRVRRPGVGDASGS